MEPDYMREKRPPQAVVSRLPGYYRCLRELLSRDILRISSGELAGEIGCTASQIRQDLSYFGAFGQQGYGYNVKHLFTGISNILGVTDEFGAVIYGAGELGRALALDPVFAKRGVILRGVFDCGGNSGSDVGGHTVCGVPALLKFIDDGKADILVLTKILPGDADAGSLINSRKLRGIWNFTSEALQGNETTIVRNVFLGDSLMTLCYDIKRSEAQKTAAPENSKDL